MDLSHLSPSTHPVNNIAHGVAVHLSSRAESQAGHLGRLCNALHVSQKLKEFGFPKRGCQTKKDWFSKRF